MTDHIAAAKELLCENLKHLTVLDARLPNDIGVQYVTQNTVDAIAELNEAMGLKGMVKA